LLKNLHPNNEEVIRVLYNFEIMFW